MKKFFKPLTLLSVGIIGTTLIIGGCSSPGNDDSKLEIIESESTEKKAAKEIKTLFLPMGRFTSGFIYCGFDGEKSILDELINEGWEVKNVTPQNFQTVKRNGDIVLCNGNSYLLEK